MPTSEPAEPSAKAIRLAALQAATATTAPLKDDADTYDESGAKNRLLDRASEFERYVQGW